MVGNVLAGRGAIVFNGVCHISQVEGEKYILIISEQPSLDLSFTSFVEVPPGEEEIYIRAHQDLIRDIESMRK